jgi:magnesium transporter
VPGSCFYQIGNIGPPKCEGRAEPAVAAAEVSGVAGLHYGEATKEELMGVVDLLGLNSLSIEDCLDDNQIPKIEDFPEDTFILFNAFEYDDGVVEGGEINWFIGEKFLVSASHLNTRQPPYLEGIQRMVEKSLAGERQGPSEVMVLILDFVVDQKFEALEDGSDGVERTGSRRNRLL